MKVPKAKLRCILAAVMLLQSVVVAPTSADPNVLLGKLHRFCKESRYHGTEPQSGGDCAIEYLAENIDWLEHHIDTYGSIVAKQPDIWGEARLTKHRDEYERIMFQELGGFKQLINAQILETDSSFLAQSLALSAAASQSAPPIAAELKAATEIKTSTGNIQGADEIGLEPVLHLDQLSRYLQHLHELRRIGEGDDTSDSPGYSLNLVRIPVSIMPGKLTREGFGAEVTVIATPVLSDDLLPTTFRNLVINDVVDQLGLPLVRAVESREEIKEALRTKRAFAEARNLVDDMLFCFIEHPRMPADKLRDKCFATIRRAVANSTVREIFMFAITEVLETEGHPYADSVTNKCGSNGDRVEMVGRGPNQQLLEETWNHIRSTRSYTQTATGYGNSGVDADHAHSETLPPPIAAFDPNLSRQQAIYDTYYDKEPWSPSEDEYENLIKLLQRLYCGLACYANASSKLRAADCKCCAECCGDGCGPDETSPEAEPEATEVETSQVEASDEERNSDSPVVEADSESNDPFECLFDYMVKLNQSDHPLVYQITNDLSKGLDNIAVRTANELIAVMPSGRARRATNPLHPSAMIKVLGIENLVSMGDFFGKAYYGRYIRWAGYNDCQGGKKECRVDLLDAQRWLRSEMAAAHEFFASTDHVGILCAFANPNSGLAAAIRAGHISDPDVIDLPNQASVESYRWAFFEMIHSDRVGSAHDLAVAIQNGDFEAEEPEARNPVEALAWAYVVESALLNQRLNDDIRKLAQAKQRYDIDPGRDLCFFIPDTVMRPDSEAAHLQSEFQEATACFQQYVSVRWPIHVFALDPREQDQNVADASKRRREMQFAMSLGFVTGKIGGNSLTQYARTLEKEIQIISLNRTAAGFAHGNDTFGWRFAPRVQALEPPGTLTVLAESICGPFANRDLNNRDIEPGMRECVAIVIMPSFVPYADFDVRTNWFKLSNPKNAALTMKDTMRLSRAVTAMRNSRAQCARCQHRYREGEVTRLMRRVEQLDRELPLQSMRAQVPYENTLGGFEMFNTGVTDLAPELIGWYGAPGVVVGDESTNKYACGCTADCQGGGRTVIQHTDDRTQPLPICEGSGTTLFLVGDNFSVHDTKVIAGGVCIPHVQLVSREIMRVTIPSCVSSVDVDGKPYVSVYAATPYGVTNHLHVPVHTRKLTSETKDLVKKEVEDQIKAANVTPAIDHALTLVNASDKTLLVDANCENTTDPGTLTYKIRPGSTTPELKYKLNHPPSVGQVAVISAVFQHKDKYLGTPIKLVDFEIKPNGNEFLATGDTAEIQLMAQLRDTPGLPYQDLADGKEELKLVYFVQIGGAAVPVLIPTALNVEVAMLCKGSGSSMAGPSPTPAAAAATSNLTPTFEPMPLDDGSDCGCREAMPRPITSRVRFLANPVPVASEPGPSRVMLTQLNTSVVEEDLDPTLSLPAFAFSASAEAALSVIELDAETSMETLPAPAEPAMVVSSDSNPAPVANVETCSPTVVNVNVNLPDHQHEAVRFECFDASKRPLWTQFKVKAEECARNMRDQLPCY